MKYIIDRLNTQHLALPNIIAHLSDLHLHLSPSPGKWNIKDNIAHLARYQTVFLKRMHLIITMDNPSFDPYKAEEDGEFPLWQSRDLLELQNALNADRVLITEFMTSLPTNDWQRTGVHSKYGMLRVIDWTEFFLLHEAHHLFTIFQLAHNRESK